MRVHGDPGAEPLGAVVHAPALRVGDEEALLRRVAVNQSRAPVALQRLLERVIPGEQPAEVGDLLAAAPCDQEARDQGVLRDRRQVAVRFPQTRDCVEDLPDGWERRPVSTIGPLHQRA